MHSDGNVFKIRRVCFKVIYLITYQSLSSTFKRSIFMTKFLANAPLRLVNDAKIIEFSDPFLLSLKWGLSR